MFTLVGDWLAGLGMIMIKYPTWECHQFFLVIFVFSITDAQTDRQTESGMEAAHCLKRIMFLKNRPQKSKLGSKNAPATFFYYMGF